MKFAIVALALLGVVAADVSHLNNMYLPPVLAGLAPKQHVSYAQEAQEIPQAPVQEVVDNSVVEAAPAPQVHAAVAHHVQAAAAVAHKVHAHVQEAVAATVEADAPAAPGSEVYQSTHQQAEYYTQQQEQEQQQVQEPEQQYYTGLVHHEGQEAFEQHAEVAAPQQAAVEQHQYHHVEHHVEHHAEPQHSAVHVEHHVAVSAPVAQEAQADFAGEQFASVSVGSSASSSSGIDTQYAANGGYVY
ncbi:TOX high mobility group box family member 3-like [Lucilia sericata]|uniref:TOX high mobility group box family member 3-like n=1 Tax=Lucilia sericata TaxID=13632 RepID=UPI0018A82122|nr:TOX high mobility group box family member 3-like [Lucilia sericata]